MILTPNQQLGFEGDLISAVLEGFKSYSNARGVIEGVFATCKTTRSNLLHCAVVERVKLLLQGGRFRFASVRHGGPARKLLVIDAALALQFKLASASGRGSNVSTRVQRHLLQTGDFPVGWAGPLPLQTILYELDEARTVVSKIWVVTHGRGAQARFLIYDRAPEQTETFFDNLQKPKDTQPHERNGSPGQRRKRIRRPDEDDGDSAAGAVSA